MNYVDTQVETVQFDTMSGVLTVVKKVDLYEMDFPTVPLEECPVTEQMIEALGIMPVETYLNRDLVFVLESEEAVKNPTPDFAKLETLPEGLGVCITAKGSEKHDFVSRGFFPKLKINEDPVTGSLHCGLIPFWSERLGKSELVAKQLSNRGGTLYCKHEGSRVKIAGKAALYSIAELYIGE
jgi:predicted PhzF superfamily epimerase YddE/YHI9